MILMHFGGDFTKKIALLILAFSVSTLMVGFYSGSLVSGLNGPVVNVSMGDSFFSPSSVTVGSPNSTSGEYATIVWTNNGITVHTVTSGDGTTGTPDGLFDSGSLNPGQTFTLQINETMYASILAKYPDGKVPYFCSFHFSLGMTGEITVSPTAVPEFPSLVPMVSLMTATLLLAAFVYQRKRS